MAKEIKLTQESLDAYKDELEYLKTTRADEVAEQLKEARSFGDLSENAEYDEAKNEQGKLYSRIAELEEIIKHAVVVTGDSYAADEVSPGCRFIVKDLEEDEEEEYHFVGSQEPIRWTARSLTSLRSARLCWARRSAMLLRSRHRSAS